MLGLVACWRYDLTKDGAKRANSSLLSRHLADHIQAIWMICYMYQTNNAFVLSVKHF